jgi:DtxR family Mn-dependent transcriptional regulator
MEHVIDRKTIDRLVCFIEYIHTCPRAGVEWLESFVRFCKSDRKHSGKCTTCIRELKVAKEQKPRKP